MALNSKRKKRIKGMNVCRFLNLKESFLSRSARPFLKNCAVDGVSRRSQKGRKFYLLSRERVIE